MAESCDRECSPSILEEDATLDSFYTTYAQDIDKDIEAYFAEKSNIKEIVKDPSSSTQKVSKPPQKSKNHKKKKVSFKKTTCCNMASTSSFVIRKDQKKGHHVIKIEVYEINNQSNNNTSGSASVNVQYVVKDNYDNIMDATNCLISRIVKKLSDSDDL